MDEQKVLSDFKKALRAAKLPVASLSRRTAYGGQPSASSGRVATHRHGGARAFADHLTMNTYVHVMPAMLEDAASKMDAILKEKAPAIWELLE
jgi:predicted GIY-YIG superfamily endonuclease